MQTIQNHILKRQLDQGRIAQAYILEGQKEFTMPDSMAFAQTLICLKGQAVACQTCSTCHKFSSQSLADFLRLNPVRDNIPIDSIRSIVAFFSKRPLEAARKVVLIEDAHKMRLESANALLKTLEEPPSYGVLLLTVPSRDRLLPTIVSRCQVIRYEGSMEKTSLQDQEQLFQILLSVAEGDLIQVFANKDFFGNYQPAKELLFQTISSFFRDVHIFKKTQSAEHLRYPVYSQFSARAAVNLTEQRLEEILVKVDEVYFYLHRNVNYQMSMEELMLTIGGFA